MVVYIQIAFNKLLFVFISLIHLLNRSNVSMPSLWMLVVQLLWSLWWSFQSCALFWFLVLQTQLTQNSKLNLLLLLRLSWMRRKPTLLWKRLLCSHVAQKLLQKHSQMIQYYLLYFIPYLFLYNLTLSKLVPISQIWHQDLYFLFIKLPFISLIEQKWKPNKKSQPSRCINLSLISNLTKFNLPCQKKSLAKSSASVRETLISHVSTSTVSSTHSCAKTNSAHATQNIKAASLSKLPALWAALWTKSLRPKSFRILSTMAFKQSSIISQISRINLSNKSNKNFNSLDLTKAKKTFSNLSSQETSRRLQEKNFGLPISIFKNKKTLNKK